MKRRNVLWLMGGVVLVIVLVLLFSSYTINKSVLIHASIEKVALQFSKAENWKHWHPVVRNYANTAKINAIDYKNQIIDLPDGLQYSIHVESPAVVEVEKNEKGNISHSFFAAMPYKDGSYTLVSYEANITGFEWLKEKFRNQQMSKSETDLLAPLQAFVEDDKRSYGFFIVITPVKDTLILTATDTIAKEEATATIPKLYNKLTAFYTMHQVAMTARYYYVSMSYPDEKKVVLSVGIPVSKEVVNKDISIQFLRLPASGRLIQGLYEGRYDDRKKLYAAMDEYTLDKRLKKVAQPLEKYDVKDTLLSPAKDVHLQLFYPIF